MALGAVWWEKARAVVPEEGREVPFKERQRQPRHRHALPAAALRAAAAAPSDRGINPTAALGAAAPSSSLAAAEQCNDWLEEAGKDPASRRRGGRRGSVNLPQAAEFDGSAFAALGLESCRDCLLLSGAEAVGEPRLLIVCALRQRRRAAK